MATRSWSLILSNSSMHTMPWAPHPPKSATHPQITDKTPRNHRRYTPKSQTVDPEITDRTPRNHTQHRNLSTSVAQSSHSTIRYVSTGQRVGGAWGDSTICYVISVGSA
eukprot:1780883-Rhodomonas_salina.4